MRFSKHGEDGSRRSISISAVPRRPSDHKALACMHTALSQSKLPSWWVPEKMLVQEHDAIAILPPIAVWPGESRELLG